MSLKSTSSRIHVQVCMWTCLFGFLFMLPGCEDEPVQRAYPRVKTLEVTNITPEGALFTAEVYEPGNGKITDHGFVWALSQPNLEYDELVSLGPCEGTPRFTATITSRLQEGVEYYVRAFLKAGQYTVYGQEVKFTSLGSLGPIITGIVPVTAFCGDTILVRGRNFSRVNNMGFIDGIQTFVAYPTSDSLLKIAVPFSLVKRENTVSIEVAGNRTDYTAEKLIVPVPYVDTVLSAGAYWGDTVTIKLNNIIYVTGSVGVGLFLDDILIPRIFNYKPGEYKFVLPPSTTSNRVDLTMSFFQREITVPVRFGLPDVESISSLSAVSGSVVTLYGYYKHPEQITGVSFGNTTASILSRSTDSIQVVVPTRFSGSYPLNILVGTNKIIATNSFEIICPWSILPNLPLNSSYAFAMALGEDVYIATCTDNTYWEKVLYRFNQADGTFSKMNSVRYTLPFYWPAVVNKGNKAYLVNFGHDHPEVHSFDKATLQFRKVSDYPGGLFDDLILLEGDSVLYMGGGYSGRDGYSREFWKMNYSTLVWTRLNDLPGRSCNTNEFTINGRCYVVMTSNLFYEYDPANDSWISRAIYPGIWCRYKVSVVSGNRAYMGFGDRANNLFYTYDPAADAWERVAMVTSSFKSYCIGFSLNGTVYLGEGNFSKPFYSYKPLEGN